MNRFRRLPQLALAIHTLTASSALAATTYVSQGGGAFSGGTACNGQTTVSVATFNASTPAAGDLVYLCGTVTSAVSLGGGGASGSPVTLQFDTGAKISLPNCGNACLDLGSSNYVTVNGGTPCGPGTACAANDTGTGIIEATANGSGLANTDGTANGINAGGHDITLENLIVRNIYQHTSAQDLCCGGGGAPAVYSVISSNASMHDSTFHDVGSAWRQNGAISNVEFNDNYLWNYNWGYQAGAGGTQVLQNTLVHDNHFGASLNWDDANDTNHHDDIFLFGSLFDAGGTAVYSGTFSGVWIYNNLFDQNQGANMTGRIYLSGVALQDTYIYNNIFLAEGNGPTNSSLEEGGSSWNGGSQTFTFNNTVVGTWPTSLKNTNGAQQAGAATFENNVVTATPALVYVLSGSTLVDFDYNAYGSNCESMGCGNTWQSPLGSTDSFSTWQSYAGEAHSTYTASGALGLDDAGAPEAGSIVIDGGMNLTSLCSQPNLAALCCDSSAGHTRVPTARPATGAWDVGAFNYVGAGACPLDGGTVIVTTSATSGTGSGSGSSSGAATTSATSGTSGAGTTGSSSTSSSTSGSSGACQTSTAAWQNFAFAAQTSSFTAELDATPAAASLDAVTGLSNGPATAFADLALDVRFNTTGTIDALNGGAYASAASIPYTAGTSYHFRLVVDLGNQTYSVYVTPAGGTEETLGSGYAFRAGQPTVTSLNNWALYSDVGSHEVCNFVIDGAGTTSGSTSGTSGGSTGGASTGGLDDGGSASSASSGCGCGSASGGDQMLALLCAAGMLSRKRRPASR